MEELYKQNAKIVYHFLYTKCKDETLAEELLQDTFLKAFESMERFDGSCKISTWLCQIARHLLYQHWEKEKKASFAELTEELPARSDTEQQALHKVELSEVLEALNRLPVDVAQVVNTFVVTMHGKVNMKYEKVEKVMTGLSLGAIVYALFWYCFMMISAGDGNVPLGFELGQVGPFLHLHTGIALAVEIAVFAYTMVRYMKRDIVCRGTLLISLTGLFFILAQTTLLGSLSELETHMRDFTEAAVVILGAGAACGLVLWGTEKFRRKQNGLR